jgi:hypothetical protein
MYGIWKVWRLGYWRWLLVTAISMAFVLQSHYLGLLLLPTIGLFWFLALLRHPDPSRVKYTLISTLLFLILMSPLLIFDLNPAHRWLNTSAMIKFFTDRQTTVNAKPYKALPNMFPLFTQLQTTLILGKNPDYSVFFAGLITLALVVMLVTHYNPDLFFSCTWIFFGLAGLALYKQHIYDHYFGFLFPVVFLLLGFLIKFASVHRLGKFAVGILFLGIVFLNFSKLPLSYPPNYQLDHTRQVAALIKNESHGQPLNFALIAAHNYDKSYRYFLAADEVPYYSIHDKLTDQLFVVCEDPVCEPIGNPLWEVAAFGWAKVDKLWEFSWGVKLYRLVHNPSGHPS